MRSDTRFFQIGMEYAHSADVLVREQLARPSKFNLSLPIDFMFAHSLELMLKGCLLAHDENARIEEFQHDILRLFDESKKTPPMGALVQAIEDETPMMWKARLRSARDDYKNSLGIGEAPAEMLEGLGIYDNETIGGALPQLRSQVVWLSERHKDSGSKFKYGGMGWDQRPQINAFDISDDLVWTSVSWACAELFKRFRAQCARKNA